MYLKRIEMHGFKSFADQSVILFQPGITGIVGPNGCGKSNINDAIRWVLGEQSAKQLRGSSMLDVIFNGSQTRKPQNLAEVTLVFDNEDRYIDSDYREIEITRRLYREGDSEYLLNRTPCRLKDIVDLMMDTGLGRDSLSIISQGNISSFADAKPEERRAIFEEAAGVAKYKKRKDEALRRLQRTTDNLDRVEDIVLELEKQLNPLLRQKQKAEQYLAYRDELFSIEISLIVHELKAYRERMEALKKESAALEIELALKQNNENLMDATSKTLNEKMTVLDKEVNDLQTELMNAMHEQSEAERRKVEQDAKREYALQKSGDSLQAQIEALKHKLRESIQDYNDRVDRLDGINQDIQGLYSEKNALTNKMNTLRSQHDAKNNDVQLLRASRVSLIDMIENQSHLPQGVQTIVNAGKNIQGYQGLVQDLIEIQPEYETAINTALGPAATHIIMKDEASSRKAIAYLKNNRAGRATFLPMDVMKARTIPEQQMVVAQGIDGYLGTAMDFISTKPQYKNVLGSQLGNVFITKNMESANNLSHYTYQRYRVVTLDGEVVNVGGSMTGGAFRQNRTQSQKGAKQELSRVEENINQLENELVRLRSDINTCDMQLTELNNKLLQKQISRGQLEDVARNLLGEINATKAQYESLSDEKVELDDLKSGKEEDRLLTLLNEAKAKVDEYSSEIQSKRQLRMTYMEENEQQQHDLRQLRADIQVLTRQIQEASIEMTRIDGEINHSLTHLNQEYQMTYETALEHAKEDLDFEEARDDVLRLRNDINALGHINLDAIEEYKEVSERYETLNAQRLDLIAAQESILKAIKEMDDVMEVQFDTTFKKINEEFNYVFRRLFGGGQARLHYSNPDNILETGIDIEVQPPGKKVQNISLFSGGEKALIALSGLFAILRARPVPMCLLDEVEAALDQANVERFAKFLKDFSGKTQFIVVTHRPGTMEECDALYGATMQESGVTRLVSVQLSDAIGLADSEGVA